MDDYWYGLAIVGACIAGIAVILGVIVLVSEILDRVSDETERRIYFGGKILLFAVLLLVALPLWIGSLRHVS